MVKLTADQCVTAISFMENAHQNGWKLTHEEVVDILKGNYDKIIDDHSDEPSSFITTQCENITHFLVECRYKKCDLDNEEITHILRMDFDFVRKANEEIPQKETNKILEYAKVWHATQIDDIVEVKINEDGVKICPICDDRIYNYSANVTCPRDHHWVQESGKFWKYRGIFDWNKFKNGGNDD